MAWHVMSGGVNQKKKIGVMSRVGDRDSAHPINTPSFHFLVGEDGPLGILWMKKLAL
jgi:hypothetical protein